jgi:hypothetical protein
MRESWLVPAALVGMVLAIATARAADKDLAQCLDVATTLEAGGDVTDKALTAAHQACEHAKQTVSDASSRTKLNAAYATVDDETRKRQAAHHSP